MVAEGAPRTDKTNVSHQYDVAGSLEHSGLLSAIHLPSEAQLDRCQRNQSHLWEVNRFQSRGERVPRILVVDDDDSMRNILRMRLADEYEVIDTGDPELALGLALEHKPDAVVLVLVMPKVSGFELCQNLRALS
jgi:PleD family two-component response regulator